MSVINYNTVKMSVSMATTELAKEWVTNSRDECLQIIYDPLVPILYDLEAHQVRYTFVSYSKHPSCSQPRQDLNHPLGQRILYKIFF